jgi:uncharacterized RDD family membrane protein YckC
MITMSEPHYAAPQSQTHSASPVPYQPAAGAVQPYQPPQPQPLMARQPLMANLTAPPPALVSAGGRLGASLLDGLLAIVTLWIGWAIWSLFTWSDGQTPGKKLLGHVTADAVTGRPLDWGQMAMRELCIKGLLGSLLNTVTFSIYAWIDCFSVFGERQRTVHDRMAGSIVRHV